MLKFTFSNFDSSSDAIIDEIEAFLTVDDAYALAAEFRNIAQPPFNTIFRGTLLADLQSNTTYEYELKKGELCFYHFTVTSPQCAISYLMTGIDVEAVRDGLDLLARIKFDNDEYTETLVKDDAH